MQADDRIRGEPSRYRAIALATTRWSRPNPSTAARRRAGGAEATRVEAYVAGALAPATRRAYATDWRAFATWCSTRGLFDPGAPAHSRREDADRRAQEKCWMVEDDRGAMLRALADEDTLRVFARVVTAAGTGLPQRSAGSISYHYVTAHGVSRQTGLAVSAVLGAGRRLTEAGLTIEGTDGTSWRTDFSRCAAPPSPSKAADREARYAGDANPAQAPASKVPITSCSRALPSWDRYAPLSVLERSSPAADALTCELRLRSRRPAYTRRRRATCLAERRSTCWRWGPTVTPGARRRSAPRQ